MPFVVVKKILRAKPPGIHSNTLETFFMAQPGSREGIAKFDETNVKVFQFRVCNAVQCVFSFSR